MTFMLRLNLAVVLVGALTLVAPDMASALPQTAEATQTTEAPQVDASAPDIGQTAAAPAQIPLRRLGDPAAQVTIEEYASFICDDCAVWHTTVLPQLIPDFISTGRVNLVFHDVVTSPIEHSVKASAIGLCAPAGAFYTVADSFMSGLASAIANTDNITAWYDAAIAATGETPETIEACAASEATYNILKAENDSATLLDVQNLPVIRVNGKVVADPTLEAVRAAILAALPGTEEVPATAPAPDSPAAPAAPQVSP